MPLKHLLCPGHMNLGGISPVHCRRRFASVVQEISWFTAKSNADAYCHLQGKVPYWEGGVSSKRKSRVPAASDRHAGSTHEQQWCWVSITGPVCTAGSCCRVAARGNPAASFGCLRADPDRSVTWLLVVLSRLWTPLTMFHANLPMHAGCLGRWIIRACFSGR